MMLIALDFDHAATSDSVSKFLSVLTKELNGIDNDVEFIVLHDIASQSPINRHETPMQWRSWLSPAHEQGEEAVLGEWRKNVAEKLRAAVIRESKADFVLTYFSRFPEAPHANNGSEASCLILHDGENHGAPDSDDDGAFSDSALLVLPLPKSIPQDIAAADIPNEHIGERLPEDAKLAAEMLVAEVKRIAGRRPAATSVMHQSSGRKPTLAYVGPLPPERTGIAFYAARQIPLLAQYYAITVIVDQPRVGKQWKNNPHCQIRSFDWFLSNWRRFDRVLYQIGNSSFHRHMFDLMAIVPGAVMLHDFFLSSAQYAMSAGGYYPNQLAQAIYESHGYPGLIDKGWGGDASKLVWKYPCNLSVLQRALGVIVHSQHSIDLVQRWYDDLDLEGWRIVPHAAQEGFGEFDKQSARRKLGFKGDDFIVCSFGLIGVKKLYHRLLELWQKSEMSRDPSCRLILVGQESSNAYGKSILEFIRANGLQHNVTITGWTDYPTYQLYLQAGDMSVQLRAKSRGETSGTALECMNWGMPLIVNASGTMADLPSDSVCILPECFVDREMLDAMEELWRDKRKRIEMGAKSRDYLRETNDPQRCAQLYYDAIESFYHRARQGKMGVIANAIRSLPQSDSSVTALKSVSKAIAASLPDKPRVRRFWIDVSELTVDEPGGARFPMKLLRALLSLELTGWRIEPFYFAPDGMLRHARELALKLLHLPSVNTILDSIIDYQGGDSCLALAPIPNTEDRGKYYDSLRNAGVDIWWAVAKTPPETSSNLPEDMSEYDGIVSFSQESDLLLRKAFAERFGNDKAGRFFRTQSGAIGDIHYPEWSKRATPPLAEVDTDFYGKNCTPTLLDSQFKIPDWNRTWNHCARNIVAHILGNGEEITWEPRPIDVPERILPGFSITNDKSYIEFHDVFLSGWAGVEEGWIWQCQPIAALNVPVPRNARFISLGINAYVPYIGYQQTAAFVVNGLIVAEETFCLPWGKKNVVIPIAPDATVLLRVHVWIKNLIAPASFAPNADKRHLGVRLYGVEFFDEHGISLKESQTNISEELP